MGQFHGYWDSPGDVFKSFEMEDPGDIEILYAAYTSESYDGDATVVYRDAEGLHCVEGGHCSCYGLEGQWGPTRTSPEALRMMPPSERRPDFDKFLETL